MSKVILYMAISADGFIAGVNNETPWSDEEWEAYREFVMSCDVCLIGSRQPQLDLNFSTTAECDNGRDDRSFDYLQKKSSSRQVKAIVAIAHIG